VSYNQLDAVAFAAAERARDQIRSLQQTLGIIRPPSDDKLSEYSLTRAIAWKAGRRHDDEAGLERFVHDEFTRSGRQTLSPRSVLVPPRALMRHLGARALQPYQTTVAGSGAALVETTLLTGSFIDALRSRSVVGQLGAQTLGGLQGDVQIPRQVTASTAYWTTPSGSPVQSGAITESEATFDSSPLLVGPRQIGAYSGISRPLLQQFELADAVITSDLFQTLATAIDVAAIQGSGTDGAPGGILSTAGINTVAGAGFSYATSVSALTALTTQNAVRNRRTLGWTADPTTAGALTQRFKVPTYSFSPLWGGNADTGEVNGHLALASNNLPAGTAIFGDWSQLLILQWGDAEAPIEIEVNSYGAGFAAGDVQIRAMLSANIAVRHPQSFTVVTGIT
jgi:HK97 family phage major capsid protein